MKILVSLLMIAAFSYLGYQYGWPYTQNLIKPNEANLVEESPPRLAPDGVFFIIEKFSHVTEEGIVALHPGTEVTLIQDGGAILTVSDGRQEFEIPREKLSNDLDIRDAALRGDLELQENFHSALASLDAAGLARGEQEISDAQQKIKKLDLLIRQANVLKERLVREFQEKYKKAPNPRAAIRSDDEGKSNHNIAAVDASIQRMRDEIVDLNLFIDRKRIESKK